MHDAIADCQEVQSLIERLSEAVGSIDQDDLSGLAKMHGWCEALAEATGPNAEQPCQRTSEQAVSLGRALESLILDDVEDVEATLASIRAIVSSLAGDGDAAKDKPSDTEVAARLDRIFEEEISPAEPSQSDAEAEQADQTAGQEPSQASLPEGVTDAEQATPDAEPPYEPIPLTIDMKELEFVKGFVEEAGEHIEAIEAGLLEMEQAPGDTGKIDDVFRPFHTIKGMAGFLNLRDINCLTHEAETLLDQGRKGKRTIGPGLIDLIFDVVDILKAQIASVSVFVADPNDRPIPQPPVAEMIGRLRDVVAGRIDPEDGRTSTERPPEKVGEHLVAQKACAKEVVDFAVETQQARKPDDKTGRILVEMGAATPRQVNQALRAQTDMRRGGTSSPGQSAVADHSVRIDTTKLDALVDMVGELVIAQTQVAASDLVTNDPKLTKNVSQVGKIVRDVQEVAMAMRMIPIGSTFQKMARLVRDVSRKAGKRVELHISGEETELDKNVIQQINDPLIHMVRNAVDHGIELPQQRREAGKDEVGHVHLSAFHHGGNIVIEIRDDGKGLDAEKLIAKAIEKGIIQGGEELTEQQAFGLIFAPGFSTADKVTDISGRGVGMDVVRRNIEQLRGKVEITSELGKGSTFLIRLPLTLAIIDGMVVALGGERFILPTIAIEQALRPRPEQIATVQHKGEVIKVRGRLIPLIQLGELFGLTGRIDPCEAMVVIAYCDDRQIGLVVEELIGQQQVVIKSLGEKFEKLKGISGAAILGDGRVGLILEIPGLVSAHNTGSAGADHSGSRSPGHEDGLEESVSPEQPESPSKVDERTAECVPL